MIELRVLCPDDWPLWRRLRLAALTDTPAAFGSTLAGTLADDTEQRWRQRLTSVPLNVVLTVDGEPAGMVSGTEPDDGGAVELVSLWVAPAARGQGVGDAAIGCVLAWASERGAPVVLAVKEGNAAAIALYERHGFRDAGASPEDPTERLMRY